MRKSHREGALASISSSDLVHVVQAKGRTALKLRSIRSAKSTIWKVVLLSATIVWLIDFVTKAWALSSLESRASVKIFGDFLTLRLAKNSGAAFSMGEGGTFFLSLFAIFVIFAIIYWAPKVRSRLWGIVFGFVLGGALGNLTDRAFRGDNGHSPEGAFRGRVIDWIALPHWPIFNLADSAIVIAALLATFLTFRNISPTEPQRKIRN